MRRSKNKEFNLNGIMQGISKLKKEIKERYPDERMLIESVVTGGEAG